MSDSMMVVFLMGFLSLSLIVLAAYAVKSGNSQAVKILEPFMPALKHSVRQLDVALAPYGAQLRMVNDAINAAQTFVDEDTDALVAGLPPEITAAARVLLDYTAKLTDGVVNPED